MQFARKSEKISAFLLITAALLISLSQLGCFSAYKNFRMFQQKAMQSEARVYLKAIFTAEVAYQGELNTYCPTFDGMNFYLESGEENLYSYFLPGQVIQAKKGGPYELPEGVTVYADENGFQAVAVANLDKDPTLDVWVINQNNELINVTSDLGKQK